MNLNKWVASISNWVYFIKPATLINFLHFVTTLCELCTIGAALRFPHILSNKNFAHFYTPQYSFTPSWRERVCDRSIVNISTLRNKQCTASNKKDLFRVYERVREDGRGEGAGVEPEGDEGSNRKGTLLPTHHLASCGSGTRRTEAEYYFSGLVPATSVRPRIYWSRWPL